MSNEEKKAIEYLKRNNIVEIQYDDYGLESIHRIGIDEKQTILNLIEKQQKEIEELKRQDLSNSKIIANMSERHFHDREKIRKYEALQDKIKAKMKEKEWSLENYDCDEADYKQSQAIGAWCVLQSLLDK